jgi:hypothetical protein
MSDRAPVADLAVGGGLAVSPATWPDELWAGSVGRCDAMLRSYYGVREFTDDPACVFRIGVGKARATLRLSDGTLVRSGEAVGTLHFWNEHLPRRGRYGRGLGWACAMRGRVVRSLAELAAFVETDPAWREIAAFHAEAGLSARMGSGQVERVVRRYGFERTAPEPSLLRRVHNFGDDFLLWGLARAFNPRALPRLRFWREHQDLWISRTALRRQYLARRPTAADPPRSDGAG